MIASDGVASLWALKSIEFQVHFNSDPDGSKLVVSSSICGPINVQPMTYAQPQIHQLLPLIGYYPVIAQSLLVPSVLDGNLYMVRTGDTLFRISRRYHCTVEDFVLANHILSPNLIYSGQIFVIPQACS